MIARSLEGGFKAGLLLQIGLCTGLLAHLIAATLGISAVISKSAVAFETLRYIGCGYLVWLAIRTWLGGSDEAKDIDCLYSPAGPRSSFCLFVDGFIIDTFNPKPALFFLAVLPQFARSDALDVPLQIGLLGSIFIVLALVTGSGYAALAGVAARRFRSSVRARRITRWATGSTYLLLAGAAAAWRR